MLPLRGSTNAALTRKKPSKTESQDVPVRRQSQHTHGIYLRGRDSRIRGPRSTRSLPPSHAGSPPPWCMSTAFSMLSKEELETTTSQTESTRTPATTGTDDTMPAPAPSPGMLSRLGQNLNMAGVGLFLQILGGDQRLAVPHLTLPDIQTVDWAALRAAGFKAVVFDKDNTLTRPFAVQVEPQLVASLERCKGVFGSAGIALYSNSAGLRQYDPEGHEAASLEAALGVAVMRHTQKKPAGDAGEVADHFGCAKHELIMVGDRYLTDVVFGNRHGMLTIRPAPLTLSGEPLGVLAARRVEEFFVGRWTSMGVAAPPHALMPAGGSTAFITSSAAITSSQQDSERA